METWNLAMETWNLAMDTWNLAMDTWNLKPILHAELSSTRFLGNINPISIEN